MNGGEVARWFSKKGATRTHSVAFASAVPPYLLQTPGNTDGPPPKAQAEEMTAQFTADPDAF
jgi:hypothetical protein